MPNLHYRDDFTEDGTDEMITALEYLAIAEPHLQRRRTFDQGRFLGHLRRDT